MHAETAMIGEPSCGFRMDAETWSLKCLGAILFVTFLFVSLLSAMIVPADRQFVAGYSFEDVCINLFSFRVAR